MKHALLKSSMIAAVLCAAAPASALSGVTFTKDSGGEGLSALMRGWAFDLAGPVSVTGLGWYDSGEDGLQISHEVGIWTSGGALVVSGVVGSGTAGTLDGFFRYTSSLTGSTSLASGSYVIAGLSGTDANYRNLLATSVTFGAGVSYLNDVAGGGTFGFASDPSAFDIGYFGPNFQYSVGNAVPEPATWAMLVMGFGLVGWSARRRKSLTRTLA